MNPFLIEGPAVISFSGGRTSGYMLRRILDAGIQKDVHVLFANTGKERNETLDFVNECDTRWGANVHWLERPDFGEGGFVEVTYQSATRLTDEKSPFEQLITERGCLPNPAQRWCTQELKIRVMKKWMQAHGYTHWPMQTGIRADEPRRIARAAEANEAGKDVYTQELPLALAGVMLAEVMGFWASQPFDLQLKSYEGNCTICFLKHVNKRERIAKDRPDLLRWWSEQERRTGQFFRLNEPDYATLPLVGNLFDEDKSLDLPDIAECVCQ